MSKKLTLLDIKSKKMGKNNPTATIPIANNTSDIKILCFTKLENSEFLPDARSLENLGWRELNGTCAT